MKLRTLHILCANDKALKRIRKTIDKQESVIEHWERKNKESISLYLLVSDQDQQLYDDLQDIAENEKSVRLIVQSVEAALPEDFEEKRKEDEKNKVTFFDIISRAEMLEIVKKQSRLNGSYLALIFLSSIVATIALIHGNVAILIGAMVLTPLLGPNLALAFSTATANTDLSRRAIITGLVGFGATFVTACLTGLLFGKKIDEKMLSLLFDFGFESIPIAVCAGIAATILLLQGTLSSLIGVMVAVAFLPPIAMAGLTFGTDDKYNALNAILLFAVNLASFNLAAKSVLLLAGVRPHKNEDDTDYNRNMAIYIFGWIAAIALLSIGIYYKN